MRHTRMFKPERKTAHAYFVLLQVGFTPHDITIVHRVLLPHVFTLTFTPDVRRLFSVALSMDLHPP